MTDIVALTDRLQVPCALLLFMMAVAAALIGANRFRIVVAAGQTSKEYAPRIAKLLKDRRFKEGLAISSSKNVEHSHLARVVRGALAEYQFQQESGRGGSADQMVDKIKRTTERVTELTSHELRDHLNWLTAIGATAPFVGALSGSVPIAAAGLVLAIGSIWTSAYLKRRIAWFDTEMRSAASEIVDYFDTRISS